MHATRLFTILLVFSFVSATADSLTAQTITHVPLYTFHGDDSDDDFGGAVSGAGDVNGDGIPDFIVGALGDDNNGSRSGSARVLSGSDGSVLYNFDGDSIDDIFGNSVSGAGDVNGDGRADLIVAARWDDNNGQKSGSVLVLSGSDGSVLHNFNGDSAYDEFGQSVSGAGDVNGDGIPDLIVGVVGDDNNNGNNSGSARVLSGSDGSVLQNLYGDIAGINFGSSVSGAGDVNGDGVPDLIVGARRDNLNGTQTDVGSARVLSGSDGSVLYHFDGDSPGDLFGRSVSCAGDVNGDGMADLIVGAPWANNNTGYARVLSGSDGSVLYNFDGDSGGHYFGNSVSGAGDVNGDGFSDLIVGADGNGRGNGYARVLSGIDGSVLYNFNGDSRNNYFGASVSGAGDLNGDGINDFIVGAHAGRSIGYVRVFVSQIAPSCTLGDIDLSGTVDFLDIQPFIAVLSGGTNQCEADCDQNGMVDFLDIQPFIAILSNP